MWFDFISFHFIWFKSFCQMICDFGLWSDLSFAHHWKMKHITSISSRLCVTKTPVKVDMRSSISDSLIPHPSTHMKVLAARIDTQSSHWILYNKLHRCRLVTQWIWSSDHHRVNSHWTIKTKTNTLNKKKLIFPHSLHLNIQLNVLILVIFSTPHRAIIGLLLVS